MSAIIVRAEATLTKRNPGPVIQSIVSPMN